MSIPGMKPTESSSLVRADDRLSFLYLEHCTIAKSSSALTATDENGVIHIPSAALAVLMLGPGTRVTHQAMTTIADSGMSVIWVGEEGVRYYAHGRPIGRNTRLLEAQAKIVSNQRLRLQAARAMYELRFDGEDTSGLTMQQLRGREGARIRRLYRDMSKRYDVPWDRRQYDLHNFSSGDPINVALSAAHTCLYGLVHATIVALGCSPGLGIIHTGHDRSFVYDIADLYKASITIPIAFESVVAMHDLPFSLDDLPTFTRKSCRNAFKQNRLSVKIVEDLKTLLVPEEAKSDDDSWFEDQIIQLWDDRQQRVAGGTNYEQQI
ncbi:type I-E CRISPR-associated endonuclease Cas1e [Corynebacterium sp. ES2794-CONJ1]|uniref:type I-E CRISPR-associated endonuclease Cas1e n=1 Tax=unclassified Corynebacterium TaxID=2624378 RepID=UPI002167F24F|nr:MULTISPECIES: type I-E CRISPR-associated endonuclease Cas1e [unclassified Corynebacterium]MCS4490659.1 type I-E CRISPR-associated endonuclease Cas1e [Corynebacterium sp. ES2775-CONJ]MCS4532575.1 type I-E CRISPR-associated endonuclease Cas1e [Corynebacterium sp. ES2730-CONJ]MCU9519970.1 type I-E CRISPR-associated endonuclease Cas1e [Corynebacterium sp. ES2794-CONJ1]